jgi:hypothetical protein
VVFGEKALGRREIDGGDDASCHHLGRHREVGEVHVAVDEGGREEPPRHVDRFGVALDGADRHDASLENLDVGGRSAGEPAAAQHEVSRRHAPVRSLADVDRPRVGARRGQEWPHARRATESGRGARREGDHPGAAHGQL